MAINEFDNGITQAVQSWPGWWNPVMVVASAFADPQVMVVLVVGIVIAAWKMHLPRIAAAFGWTLPAMLLNGVVKHFLHRPRPDTLYVAHMPFHSFSFPSGHAFSGMLVYGLTGYLAFKQLPAPWSYAVATVLVGLIILIGISRVYLGAHFPTDVLGGWLFGLLALVIIIFALKL